MVGDSWRDSKAAQSLGILFFPVGDYISLGDQDEEEDNFVYPSLGYAVDEILSILSIS
jgi:hypothetical protein